MNTIKIWTRDYKELREAKLSSRKLIIDTANTFRKVTESGKVVYTGRHINQAVCVVRRNKLLQDNILVDAGFNGKVLKKSHRELRITAN